MKIHQYKQSTCESCLTSCLLQLRYFHTGRKIMQKHEREMLFYALKYNRMDFVAGHLDFFENRFGIKTKRYLHNAILYGLVKDECRTSMQIRKINMGFIDKMIEKQPVAVIIDSAPLNKHLYNMIPFHYPHWIVIYEKMEAKGRDRESSYLIYEPWEGKEAAVPEKVLKDCLKSYLNHLWGAPQMICLSRKPYI